MPYKSERRFAWRRYVQGRGESATHEEGTLNDTHPDSEPIDVTTGPILEAAQHEEAPIILARDNAAEVGSIHAEEPSGLRYVFMGAEGLRAGWGILIFVAIMFAVGAAVHFVQITIKHHRSGVSVTQSAADAKAEAAKPMAPRAAIIGEGSTFLVVMLATFVMSRIERRRFGVYGLGGTRRLPQFLAGLFWGVVCLSLLVGLLRWSGFLVFDARLLSGGAALSYGLIWAVGFLFVALLEETMLRGYLQYTLARGLAGVYGAIFKESRHRHAVGFWAAALVLSFVFGLGHGHNPGESPIGLLAAGLAGLVFCFALYRTGSLWWAIGIHTSWDWAQSFLYGVADSGLMAEGHLFATHAVGKPILSGGLTGPEGSIFVILVLAVVALIIRLTLRPAPAIAAYDTGTI